MTISLPIDPDANELLTRSPLALLIGMLLDQQVTIEKAFTSPRDLARRLGHEPDAAELAGYDPGALSELFSERPALHRYPKAMAGRVQQLCQALVDGYGGDAAAVWTGARTGDQLLARIQALPGFGEDKSRILVALLGKQFEVRPKGWRKAAGRFGAQGSHCSVADITDRASLLEVRAYKQGLKAAARAG
ncbi:MAG: Fe-S cluster assembly protein HesB [Nocardiopsaceae bacterium]|nr:Fe-S cluster assembly protein HesB [Nocardiopsaceae bacterium]